MILGLLVFSVLLGLASPWAAILPGAVAAYGAALIVGADPNPGGGDADPQGYVGLLFLVLGGGCAWVVLVVGASVRRRRAKRERRENTTREYI